MKKFCIKLTCKIISSNSGANKATRFALTDTKLYASVVTIATQENMKLLQQFKTGLKRLILIT